jgi:hypothetical protein
MNNGAFELCDDEVMRQVLAEVGASAEGGLARIEQLLGEFPRDPRLHFLKGSLLVGLKRFVGAHLAMSRALEIAPDYELARFQLGFFELTSGEADAAFRTWAPLDSLAPGSWMRLFVEGLRALAEDRLADCVTALRTGIAANSENLPLNADMELIIAECERLDTSGQAGREAAGEASEVSATSLLLGNAGSRRRH